MRLSTASLILAYVAAIAVHALPVDSGNDLTLRSAEAGVAVDTRGLGDIDIETRDPDPKKYVCPVLEICDADLE